VEYFNYLGNMITYNARCTRVIKSRIVMTKIPFSKKKALPPARRKLSHQQIGLQCRNKLVKFYIRNIALCGDETVTLWKIDQKYVANF
jgi:hypothetical protein